MALIQLAEGLPPSDVQARCLQVFQPDDYYVEEVASSFAGQRVLERLEALRPGDELCVASLDVLQLGLGDLTKLLAGLLARGVRCLTLTPTGQRFSLGEGANDAALLGLLGGLADRGKAARTRAPGHESLLTQDEISDIHRLHRGGLSARRIGLIYRRSPKCISQVLASHAARREGPVQDGRAAAG